MTTLNTFLKAGLLTLCAVSALASASYTTQYRYNIGGQLTGTISPDPDGTGPLTHPAQRTTYNDQGLVELQETGVISTVPAATIAPSAWPGFTVHSSVRYHYDSRGRQTAAMARNSAQSNLSITQTSYDKWDRVRCEMVRMAATLAANPCVAANHGSVTEPAYDRVTRYTYNENDQVNRVEKAVGTSDQVNYATYTFHQMTDPISGGTIPRDSLLMASVTDANRNLSEYSYDSEGRLSRWYFPDPDRPADATDQYQGTVNARDFEQYDYDLNGNRTYHKKRSGLVINYRYDPLNRMVAKSFPASAGEDVTWTYNNLNLQTGALGRSTSVTHSYNGFGDLKTETSATGTLTYQYDKHSNQTRITFPDDQFFTYEYDNLDRFTGIKENGASQVISQTYRAQGTPWKVSRNNNNSSVTFYDHDDINRLTDLDWQRNGTPVNEFDFTYNRAGQLASQSISNHSLVHQGNTDIRGSWQVNGLNQYNNINGNSYLYDNNANLQFDGGTTYTYDSENRLKHASGTKNVTLTYDTMGRLLSKIAGGATRRYLYSGDALVAEYSGSTLLKRYVHGPGIDNPLVKYTGSSVNQASRRYLHSNHQGSIIATTDHAGTMLETNTYDSFGVPTFSATMSSNDIRFSYTGQIYIPELEMYHYKARVYDPKLGRFLQTDPIGYDDQMNLYAYVGNDPMTMVDPTGMETENKPCQIVCDAIEELINYYKEDESEDNEKKDGNSKPEIKRQKQNEHIEGTPSHKNRKKQSGNPQDWPSTWDNPDDADELTQEAWEKGTPVNGNPKVKIWKPGRRIGTKGDKSFGQDGIKVVQDSKGKIHGFPIGTIRH